MPKSLRAALVGAVLLAVLGSAQVAFAAEQPKDFPFGKYEGSAASEDGDGDPIGISIYITGDSVNDVSFTVRADGIPAPITVKPSSLGWYPERNCWVFNVSVKQFGLSGSGNGEIHPGGNPVIYGWGSGTYNKNSGNGYGSGDMVQAGQTSTGSQVIDAFNGFIGGPPEKGKVKAPKRPPGSEAGFKKSNEERRIRKEIKQMIKALFGDKPLGPLAFMVFILVAMVILMALGLV